MRTVLLALSLAGSWLCQLALSEESPRLVTRRDIPYATVDGHSLKLNLYLPAGVQSPPLVVWIHGGGWRAGTRDRPKLLELTRSGYALASISYRFTDDAIFHGDADRTVLMDQSERIVSLYTKAGLDVEQVVLKEKGHGGPAFFRGQHFEHAKRFITRTGFHQP